MRRTGSSCTATYPPGGRRHTAPVLLAQLVDAAHGRLAAGDEAFRTPVSVALLVGTAALSLAQAAVLTSHRGPWRAGRLDPTMAAARVQPTTGEQT